MSLKLSTNLRNRLLGEPVVRSIVTITATTIAAVDGGASSDTFTDSGNGFLAAGFQVGDSVLALGFTGNMAGIVGPFPITAVVAGTITVATGSLAADAAAESVTLVGLKGGALKDIFRNGVFRVYSGAQPATPDSAVQGTLLLTITLNSAAFTAGALANGLNLGVPAAGAISKVAAEVWSGVGAADGTAGWFRLCGNATDAGGADTTPFLYPRIDGAIATSGAELNMSSTTITTGATTTVDSFTLTLPGA